MLAHLGARALAGALVVAGVVTLTFLLVHAAPGDPVERLLGPTATAGQLAAQRRALGLDRSLPAQYAIWVGRFARGDWGRSIATGRPVRALLGDAVPPTRSEEHTSELQSQSNLVCRLLLEKKTKTTSMIFYASSSEYSITPLSVYS